MTTYKMERLTKKRYAWIQSEIICFTTEEISGERKRSEMNFPFQLPTVKLLVGKENY